jgi:hypothetical protein
MLFNIFLHFRRSFASSCHSGTCNSLNSGFTRRLGRASASALTRSPRPLACEAPPPLQRQRQQHPPPRRVLLLLLLLLFTATLLCGAANERPPPSPALLRPRNQGAAFGPFRTCLHLQWQAARLGATLGVGSPSHTKPR